MTNDMEFTLANQDAAKRIRDTVSLHLVAAEDLKDAVDRYCAFRLDDGTSDNALYDTKQEAIEHQKGDPKLYCYLRITPDGITVKDAWHFLKANRHWMIDTTAADHHINPTLYPQMSNLSPSQRKAIRRVEHQQRRDTAK